jgi:hypothetical protein
MNFDPRLNNVCMNANLRTIVNSCDFITSHYYELGSLNNLDNNFLDLHMHEFNNGPTSIFRPMHGQIVWDIQTFEKLTDWLELQHGTTMKQDMKYTLHLDSFPIPFPCMFVYLNQNKLGTHLRIQFHILKKCTIFCNIFPTFFHPQTWHILGSNQTNLMFSSGIPFTSHHFFLFLN